MRAERREKGGRDLQRQERDIMENEEHKLQFNSLSFRGTAWFSSNSLEWFEMQFEKDVQCHQQSC